MFRKLLYPFILSLVLSLAIANLTVADLIASYDFEDAFKDSSGNNLHGKPHGDAAIVDVDGIGLSPEHSRKSKVLTLHGKNGYVDLGNDKRFNWNGAFSACFWMKVTLWEVGWQTVLKKDNTWSFERNIDQQALAFYHWPNFVPTVSKIDNKWHHIAATYDNKKQNLYKDGKLVASKPNAGKMNVNVNPVIIGAADGKSRYFNGQIDDVRIYDNALSEDEVRKNMEVRTAVNPQQKLANTWGRIKVSK